MKSMKLVLLWITALLIAIAMYLAAGPAAMPKQASPDPGASFELVPPAFVDSVQAQPGFNLADKLDAEAGIAAYYKSLTPITINDVVSSFRVTEMVTEDYIIGSVPVSGFSEHFDAHVYVHKDGWLLAYYFKDEPASKILIPTQKTINTTKLFLALSPVAALANVPLSANDLIYYDFRYPAANNILLVAEDEYNGTDFTIKMPVGYSYNERGWAGASTCSAWTYAFTLNGVNLFSSRTYGDARYGAYGSISASQMTPDTTYTFEETGYCPYSILMITYYKP